MTDPVETRADQLLRTSEVYRRMRSQAVPVRADPAIELARNSAPHDTARALPNPQPNDAAADPPPPGPHFARRMLTRRLDIREIVLLALVLIALIVNGT